MLKDYKVEQAENKKNQGDKWQGSNNGDLWQANQHLFIQEDGKQIHLNTMSHTFNKLVKKYNETAKEPLPLIPLHGCRHTTASLLIANGVDARTVAGLLGHADTSTTLSIYSHFFKENAVKAINIIDDILGKKAQ
jgi:site-specific recombinase XerD